MAGTGCGKRVVKARLWVFLVGESGFIAGNCGPSGVEGFLDFDSQFEAVVVGIGHDFGIECGFVWSEEEGLCFSVGDASLEGFGDDGEEAGEGEVFMLGE